ncbi:hypothetical protein EC968_001021 [Mortierella alpina]|nr:hypothetical protein EC968_001021 [Mortierella alpina]
MRLSKTLLISAALAAFMAVAVAQDTPELDESSGATPALTTNASDDSVLMFSDDFDDSEDADGTEDAPAAPAVDGEDGEDDSEGDDGDDGDDDDDEAGSADEQQASSLVKRATRRRGHKSVSGKTIAISSQKEFCLFLPPMVGGDIAKNERNAIAFCSKPHNKATPGARAFPKGLIKSSHLLHNRGAHDYVQVTGRIDRTKYKLRKHDQGGQYDIKATKGSSCAGYNHFVQLIEPNENRYCLRCCMQKSDCPTNKSERGCDEIIKNGNYH